MFSFSALQRAEIAEIVALKRRQYELCDRFSALQRAEIAEIELMTREGVAVPNCFSALQRAEIAEMRRTTLRWQMTRAVSVLFNEPKLLKC